MCTRKINWHDVVVPEHRGLRELILVAMAHVLVKPHLAKAFHINIVIPCYHPCGPQPPVSRMAEDIPVFHHLLGYEVVNVLISCKHHCFRSLIINAIAPRVLKLRNVAEFKMILQDVASEERRGNPEAPIDPYRTRRVCVIPRTHLREFSCSVRVKPLPRLIMKGVTVKIGVTSLDVREVVGDIHPFYFCAVLFDDRLEIVVLTVD